MEIIDKIINFFRQVLALSPIIISVFFTLVFVFGEMASPGFALRHIVLLILTIPVPIGIGVFILSRVKKDIQKEEKYNDYSDIVRLAVDKGGKVTVTDVTVKLGLSLNEGTRRLNSMQEQGYFEIELTDQGVLVYSLVNYADSDDVENAEPV